MKNHPILFHKAERKCLNVEECTREFEKLVIKCNLQEPEEQMIVRSLGGLDPRYSNVVELQAYTTFDVVCVLAYKVEQQKKAKQTFKPPNQRPPIRNQPFNKGVPNQFLSHRILFLSIHKEPKHHKRLQHPQFDLTPIL